MGNCEETKACKPEKSSSPPPEHRQTSVHAYADWTAMQAYYGSRMAVPPYFNSAVASGHAPPYMWGPPQHMMPHYAALYPHGGVYAHPAVQLAASPVNIDSPAKSSGNSDRGLMKKLKGFDGLAMSLGNGNGNGDNAGGRSDNENSESGETEGSAEGSDGNTSERGQNGGKRSREGSPTVPEIGKTESQSGNFSSTESNGVSKKVSGITVTPTKVSGKVVGTVLSVHPTSELELKNSPTAATKVTSATTTMIHSDALLQNERELKRERRKQSNRESARRSRLRKQAEAEELAIKVGSLTSENLTLKSEINRLTDNSQKLKIQNAKLMEKLKKAQEEQETEEAGLDKKGGLTLSTANLLSKVNNNSGSGTDGETYESNNSNPKSGAKLRQLLDSSPRTDAVAAG